ncbi:MAG: LarC family nickel insertion protein, partial [Verrucomicrobia bacterium]|nr:LarC family nickel insertion protein [Verrucomicrobiota bacterium]
MWGGPSFWNRQTEKGIYLWFNASDPPSSWLPIRHQRGHVLRRSPRSGRAPGPVSGSRQFAPPPRKGSPEDRTRRPRRFGRHPLSRGGARTPPPSHGRNWAEIRDLLKKSKLAPEVRDSALAMFQRVAGAEAKLHGVPVETVHFHEVGAVDSIVDLVCAAAGVHHLRVSEITATVPVEGTGTIQCAHGKFPLPAPATAEILRGIPIRQIDVPHELTTPTGAAILAHFVKKFDLLDAFAADAIGYGLGSRDLPDRPNVLRAFLGHLSPVSPD